VPELGFSLAHLRTAPLIISSRAVAMVVICLGPCCVPLHALVPFLIGMAHQRGYLRSIKKEWFTWRWLKPRLMRAVGMSVDPEVLAKTAVKPSHVHVETKHCEDDCHKCD
jgi:hypothetical protein